MKRLLLTTAAICLFGVPAMAQEMPVTLFTIVDGETLLLRNVSTTTANCDPLFTEFKAIDVLESSPELTLEAKPDMVTINNTKGICTNPMPGVRVFITAANVSERKEVLLTWRARYKTKNGPWQQTGR